MDEGGFFLIFILPPVSFKASSYYFYSPYSHLTKSGIRSATPLHYFIKTFPKLFVKLT